MRNTSLIKLCTSIFLGCLLCLNIAAQQVVLPANQLTVADNLTSQTYNYFVFKDSKGFVWISSINGLNRYDGQKNVQYLPDETDPHSIADANIQGWFYEDKNTNVWFATVDAIHCYDRLNDRFDQYRILRDSILMSDYKVLFFDKKNEELWLSTNMGNSNGELYKIDINQPDSFTYVLNYYLTNSAVFVKESDSVMKVYVPLQGDGGVARLRISTKNENDFKFKTDTLLRGIDITRLYYENDHNIWCGGKDGLFKVNDEGEQKAIDTKFGVTLLKTINDIVSFDENHLLIGTHAEGVYLMDKKTNRIKDQLFIAQDGKVQAFNSSVDFISVDKDGTIWISTKGQGVFYLTPSHQKMTAYLQSYNGDYLGRSNIRGITEDRNGLIWCLTKGDGIIVINHLGKIIPESEYLSEALPLSFTKEIYSIFSDHNNLIFVAASDGLYVYSDSTKKFSLVPFLDGTASKGVLQGIHCKKGKILVSSLSYWIDNPLNSLCELKMTDKGLRLYPVSCEDPINDITKMFEDSNGEIYLCRENKTILIGNILNDEFIADTIINEELVVLGFAEDAKQTIWMATRTGLFQLEKKGNSYSLIKNKTFDLTNLNGILFDPVEGYLWISNNNGLHAFHPDSNTYRSFTLAEGLQSPEFNFWSALKTSSGLFAFGGTNGINIFNPQKALKLSAKIPVPKITNVLIGDEADTTLVCDLTNARNVSEFESLMLKFKKNTVSFNFAALDYCDPSANHFQFQMDGIDEDWVFSGNTNFARYPNLPIGDYTFMVRASSAEGVWSDDTEFITKLKIKILAPWYRTWLAYAFYFIAGISLIVWGIRRRINRIKKEEAFKRKEAEFKQKEAEYKQLAAETETAVLRLQMNPHFIFNSMNSISSYILERDVGTANAYLDRFAKLMRMILKLGKQPMIPVADEIDLLDQYMKTEAMRFEQKFTYDFDLGPNVDEDDTFVPTMILQPFIENAIWHGLSGKTEKGHIQVRFWQDESSLFCSIEDDGVGREASKKKKNLSAHKSKALEITRRRLNLLGEKEGKKADFTFEDLFDEAGLPTGTRVLLQIPLL